MKMVSLQPPAENIKAWGRGWKERRGEGKRVEEKEGGEKSYFQINSLVLVSG